VTGISAITSQIGAKRIEILYQLVRSEPSSGLFRAVARQGITG
jgi:hypothetical protein